MGRGGRDGEPRLRRDQGALVDNSRREGQFLAQGREGGGQKVEFGVRPARRCAPGVRVEAGFPPAVRLLTQVAVFLVANKVIVASGRLVFHRGGCDTPGAGHRKAVRADRAGGGQHYRTRGIHPGHVMIRSAPAVQQDGNHVGAYSEMGRQVKLRVAHFVIVVAGVGASQEDTIDPDDGKLSGGQTQVAVSPRGKREGRAGVVVERGCGEGFRDMEVAGVHRLRCQPSTLSMKSVRTFI